jgi:dienelactone hydrolase
MVRDPARIVSRRLAAALFALALAAPAAAQQRVVFPSLDSDVTGGSPTRLEALLWRPTGNGPSPAIVLLHGCGGLMGSGRAPTARHREWAVRFAALGFVALHVDSFRPRGFDQVCTQQQPNARPAVERTRDAYAALIWLQAQRFVDPARVGIMGWSHGGSTTLWTVGAATPARPPRLAYDFVAAVAFYPGCAAPARAPGWRTEIPLLVLIGEADDWTPAPACHALAERAARDGSPVEFVFYPGAHHGFDAPNQSIRVLPDIVSTASHTATIGTNPAARVDSIVRVSTWFRERLEP